MVLIIICLGLECGAFLHTASEDLSSDLVIFDLLPKAKESSSNFTSSSIHFQLTFDFRIAQFFMNCFERELIAS